MLQFADTDARVNLFRAGIREVTTQASVREFFAFYPTAPDKALRSCCNPVVPAQKRREDWRQR